MGIWFRSVCANADLLPVRRALIGQRDMSAVGVQLGLGGALHQHGNPALGLIQTLSLIGHHVRQLVYLTHQVGDAFLKGGPSIHAVTDAPKRAACQSLARLWLGGINPRLTFIAQSQPMRIIGLLLLLILPLPLAAGGWLRGQGAGFMSYQQSFGSDLGTVLVPSIYLDYGLRDDLTVGLIAWQKEDRQSYRVLGFARRSLPLSLEGWALSGELRLGARLATDGAVLPLGGMALGAGRGFDSGWFDSSLSVEAAWSDPQSWRAKGEATLGYNLSDHWTAMGQVRSEIAPDRRVDAVTGWAVYQVREGLRIATGAERRFGATDDTVLLLSVWSDF